MKSLMPRLARTYLEHMRNDVASAYGKTTPVQTLPDTAGNKDIVRLR